MVIPREDNIVRLYIQLASSTDPDWSPRKTATEAEVQESAKRIMQPYSIEWQTVEWFSAYPIGQGISDRYTLDQRVFLGGDACHTHSVRRPPPPLPSSLFLQTQSGTLPPHMLIAAAPCFKQPKAGQGMNTAFLDALNLAWKIHAVEAGFANRDLLKTYELERKGVAESLLDFDNRYAKLFSEKQPASGEALAASSASDETGAPDNDFITAFKEACSFTSGYGVSYGPNALNWSLDHPASSPLMSPKGTKLTPGSLFINSDVTRVVDANVVHLEQEVPLNGSFRIFVFAGNPSHTRKALRDFATSLSAQRSFYRAYMRPDIGKVSIHETHNPHSWFFTICTILARKRTDIEISRDVPGLLSGYHGHIYADDVWDRRVPNARASAHARMGFDENEGGVVVVRPDSHVGVVVRLVEGSETVDALNEYFSAFCTKNLRIASSQI